mgnify:CR=1 FL=1
MAYIGRGVEFGEFIKQSLTPNSSTTAFAMTHAASANSILVVYANVVQEPGVGYTCAGGTITFTGTPVTGTSLYIIYMGRELTSVNATTTAQVNSLIAGAGHQSSAQVTTIAQDEAAALAIALG